MSKRKISVIFVAAVIAAVLVMTSCSLINNDKGRYEFADESGTAKDAVLSDLAEYTIIRGDLCSAEETSALVTLRDTIQKNIGITLPVLTDWIGEGQQEREKEILIGDTNRKESIAEREGLGYNDYVIKKIGTKLVIAGGSGASTQAAVAYFIENYINIYNATLSYPEEGYMHKQSYIASSIKINGKPISEYELYSSDPEIDLTDIQTALSEVVAGVYVEIAETTDKYTNYIIFERTGLIASEYGTRLENDGNLYVYGSYNTIDKAKQYFKKAYFEELLKEKGTTDIDIKWHDNKVKESGKQPIYTKDALLQLLEEVSADPDSVIIGENIGGAQSMPSYTLENYYAASGKYPAMLGIDLACYGLQLPELSDEDRSRALCELTDYAASGGIITATSHFENPTGNWTMSGECYGVLGGEDKWEELLTEGTELNTKFRQELDIDAVFLDALHDNGVPVLWRPLHESNTDNFWFSAIQENTTVGAEYLKRLWIYIYEYYQSLGLDNLIWVYSPSVSNGEEGTLPVMYAYPGDEYVDIVGLDWVTEGKNELDGSGRSYETLINDSGKIGAVCEFKIKSGSEISALSKEEQNKLFSSLELLDMLYELRSKGRSFAYFLTSNGTSSVTWLCEGEAFVNDEIILTLDDIELRLR